MIYADYNGSAPLNPDVKKFLIERFEKGPFANPNAIHSLGTKVYKGMEKCRKIMADILGASPQHLIFNSGASEGISHIFYHVYLNWCKDKSHNTIIISAIEHSAVVNAAKFCATQGMNLKILPVDQDGVIDVAILEKWINENANNLALVSIMAANNETGVIQPIDQVVTLCQPFQIKCFSDTTQLIGKREFHFAQSKLDFAVCSGHKLGALTGCGILLAKSPFELNPLVFGGGQEKGLRGGTQNYLGIESMAVALTSFKDNIAHIEIIKNAREHFEKELLKRFPNIAIIGSNAPRLATTTLVAYPGIHGQAVQIELEAKDIFVTTSSACSDNEPTTSKVLKAMNVTDQIGRGVVRISIDSPHPEQDYQNILDALSRTYDKLSKVSSF